MGTLLLIAIRNLLQHRKRTLLMATAIGIVTMLLMLLSALFNGMSETMLRSSTTLSTGHVNVGGFYKITSGSAAPLVTKFAEVEKQVRELVPEVQLIVSRGRGWGKVISDTTSLQAALSGIDIKNEKNFRDVIQVEHGNIDDLAEPGTALIFAKQSKRLDVKVGDVITMSSQTFRGVNNTVDLKVVAVAKDMGMLSSWNVYVHHDAIRKLYELDPTTTGALQVYLKDARDADDVAGRLIAGLEKAGYGMMERVAEPFWRKFEVVKREDWTGQKLDVTTWTDEMRFIRYVLDTLQLLIFILVSVLLIIIVIGVMNTLWMAIRERTREIGTLRAIGMPKRTILAMFVIEVAVLAVTATTAGVVVSTLVVAGLNAMHIAVPEAFQMFLMSETLRLVVDLPTAVRSLVVIATVTTLGSLYPAWRAARLQPVTAMQSH
jgi:putative ABC transport system permease protein